MKILQKYNENTKNNKKIQKYNNKYSINDNNYF